MLVQLLVDRLPTLLLLYWGLAAGAATVALTPLPFAEGFKRAVTMSACRGKLMDLKPQRGLGPLSDATVPQAWFAHFYAVGCVWNAAVATAFLASEAYTRLQPGDRATYTAALALLQLHLIRRLLETVGLMRYPRSARMHLVAYVFGLSYYLLVPLTLLPEPALGATWSAAKQLAAGHSSLPTVPGIVAVVRQLSPLQLAGSGLFLFANVLQLDSHRLLARLSTGARSGIAAGGGGASNGTYAIPRGRAFELVSCPHYLAEILVYAGLLLLQHGTRPLMWLMCVWVVANLVLAAGMTQRWYRRQFKDYPPARCALVPFVF